MQQTSYPIDFKRGFTAAIISSFFLSTTAIFIRYLTQTYQLPALILALWRDVFVVITILPILAMVKPAFIKVNNKDLLFLAAYGLVLAAFNAFWSLSVAQNGAAVATVLVYSSAAFTALLGWMFLRETISWIKILAIAFSLMGLTLVAEAYQLSVWHSNGLGILIGILAGLAYASYSLMGRSASQRGLNAWTSLLYTFLFATLYLLLINLLPGDFVPGTAKNLTDLFWLGAAFEGWLVLFLLSAIPTVMGFGLYNLSLQYLPSSVANLILTSEPLFTTLSAYLILGERLTIIQLGGGLLVILTVVLLRIFSKEH